MYQSTMKRCVQTAAHASTGVSSVPVIFRMDCWSMMNPDASGAESVSAHVRQGQCLLGRGLTSAGVTSLSHYCLQGSDISLQGGYPELIASLG